MRRMTRADYKAYVEQWKVAGPALERIRREELRNWKYDWRVVDALLDMGARLKVSRPSSGLVEMQYWFRKLAEKQGWLPAKPAVKETAAKYRTGRKHQRRGGKRCRRTSISVTVRV